MLQGRENCPFKHEAAPATPATPAPKPEAKAKPKVEAKPKSEPSAAAKKSPKTKVKPAAPAIRLLSIATQILIALVPRDEVRQCMLALNFPLVKHRRCFG